MCHNIWDRKFLILSTIRLPFQSKASQKHFRFLYQCICLGVSIRYRDIIGLEADTTSKAYCFQVDEVTFDSGELILSGFTFGIGIHVVASAHESDFAESSV